MSATAPNAPEAVLQFPEPCPPTIEKSFPFPVWSGLLTRKHWQRIGQSLWVFLWLLDRTTTEENGWGVVLGGKPVKDDEIAGCFGFHKNKMVNHRGRLIAGRYIEARRTPYGFVYRVRNSRKFIWRKKRVNGSGDSETERVNGSGDSLPERVNGSGDSRVNGTGYYKEDLAVRPSSKTTPTPASSAFEAFWKAYPKKRDKVDAQEAWNKIKPEEIPEIMAGLEAWKASDDWKREGGKYIPYAVRFLKKRRWDDDLSGIPTASTAPRVPTATDCRPKER